MKRRLRNRGNRPKAILGSLIGVAGDIIGGLIGSSSAEENARAQADATIKAAELQADAIRQQTESARGLQIANMHFQERMNNLNRMLQQNAQVNNQLIASKENINDIRRNNMIKFKKGGAFPNTFLRGGNMPFRVKDGGRVIPREITPEGYGVYELIGNDHEHYHKTSGGKLKSGVGIEFSNGSVVEGEGNQNSSIGEYLTVTPEGAYFLSKHNIDGFNPAKAVKNGLHPLLAYNIQEAHKQSLGLNDDGSAKIKRDKKRHLNFGGRQKAEYGRWVWGQGWVEEPDIEVPYRPKENINNSYSTNIVLSNNNNNNSNKKINNWLKNNNDIIGGGLNIAGNLIGSFINTSGTNRAARILSNAENIKSAILTDAYSRMTGVPLSGLSRESFASQHYMPAVRSARETGRARLAAIERNYLNKRGVALRNNISSAAMQSRLGKISSDRIEDVNNVMDAVDERNEAIKQANNQAINQASAQNAQLDAQANRDYAQHYLQLLQYNNDIENQKIAGMAQAQANAIGDSSQVMANAKMANSQSWANSLSSSMSTIGNIYNARHNNRINLNNVMLGASTEAAVRYLGLNGTRKQKDMYKQRFQEAINSNRLSPEDVNTYKRYIQWLS